MSALPAVQERFSWSDYQQWPEGERWELIDGVAYNMSPAPTVEHQSIVLRIASRLEQRRRGKGCRPFIAPTDVKLSAFDVVQPDILVVCDPSKITTTHIEGAPDLVVEVLSPSTSGKDLREKKALYQRAGVPEYLVIHPLDRYASLFRLGEAGRYEEEIIITAEETLSLSILEGEAIPLWEVFELPAPGSVPVVKGPGGLGILPCS